jgi:nitroreductase
MIGPETKSRINELALKMKSANGPLEGAALETFTKKRINPQLIVVSQVKSSDPWQSKEDYAAVSCAIQNFMLSLAARGVGSKWSTGSMTRHAVAYELAEVPAEREEIVGFIWFGIPARTPEPRRPDLADVVRKTV